MKTRLAVGAALFLSTLTPASAALDNYQVTIWNEHNGYCKDRGTEIYRVEAFESGASVWQSTDLKLDWSATEDPKATVDIPGQPFGIDQVKIYIVKWVGNGGGLSEVALSRNGLDITAKCKVSTNAVWDKSGRFSEKRLTDKITSSANFGTGYWLLPDQQPGYVTIIPPPPDISEDSPFGRRGPPQIETVPTSFQDNAAHYLITTAEDFVVDVYYNGKAVPLNQRSLVKETFGSITEKTTIEVKPGDWIVFNVVNDRLRWGTCYFGVAGMNAPGKPVFVSRLSDPRWSCCDDLAQVAQFIAQKDSKGEPVQYVGNPWADGPKLMRDYAFNDWNGEPIWGKTRNTWIKFVYR